MVSVLVVIIGDECTRNLDFSQDCYLVYILAEMSGCSIMVFIRTCDTTRLLALMLRDLGVRAIPMSGQMTQVS